MEGVVNEPHQRCLEANQALCNEELCLVSALTWNEDQVVQWASNIIKPEHAKKLKEQEVKGEDLCNWAVQKTATEIEGMLERCGIPVGPASRLAGAILKLKAQPSTGLVDPMTRLRALQNKLNDPMFRQFSVNGALGLEDTRYFRVDISPWIMQIFIPKLLTAYCVTLVSPRANGKTSTIIQTAHFLRQSNMVPLIIDLQKSFDLRSPASFWASLSERLKRVFGKPLTSTSSLGFEQFFSVGGPLAGQKVVLFFDEFDRFLESCYKDTLQELLSTIRGMKQEPDNYVLTSVVIVGTFYLIRLNASNDEVVSMDTEDILSENSEDVDVRSPESTEKSAALNLDGSFTFISPFNIHDTIVFSTFTEGDTVALFEEFSEIRQEPVHPDIVKDVHFLTGGHRGLTCLVGKNIDETFRGKDGKIPTLDRWVAVKHKLLGPAERYGTMQKMIDNLRKETMRQYRNFLSTAILPYPIDTVFSTSSADMLKAMQYLCGEGVLYAANLDQFMITPLVKQLLLTRVMNVDKRTCPTFAVPRTERRLDIAGLVVAALPFFDKAHMVRALQESNKNNTSATTKEGRSKLVPSEATYHFELYCILASWFTEPLHVIPEVTPYLAKPSGASEARERCDFLIKDGITKRSPSYLIELECSDSVTKVMQHATTLQKQRMTKRCKEGWLVYFSLDEEYFKFEWPLMDENCHCLVVRHSPNWKTIQWATTKDNWNVLG